VRAVPVGDHGLEAPVLVKYHGGVIYTADAASGLRAWSAENGALLAAYPLKGQPASLAADAASEENESHTLAVGTQHRFFDLFSFSKKARRINAIYEHRANYQLRASSCSNVVGLAMHSSFVVTMTTSRILSIYKLAEAVEDGVMEPPRLVHSLRSQYGCLPVDVSLRTAAQTVIAAVAYPVYSLGNPWQIGLQEIQLSSDGTVLGSRTIVSNYSAVDFGYHRSIQQQNMATQPTSVSYAHPYLLLSHMDNTLTLFLVSSTADRLEIGRPTRLWGHTSSVSVALVEGKGKAVSVSKEGGEVRVWELEGSVGRHRVYPSVSIATGRASQNEAAVRSAVGFDDENLVLLRETAGGPPELVVYDFK
jgi:hypothetical protein